MKLKYIIKQIIFILFFQIDFLNINKYVSLYMYHFYTKIYIWYINNIKLDKCLL